MKRWLTDEKLLERWGPPLAVFAALLGALLVARYVLLRLLRRHAPGPGSLAAVFAETISFPSVLWALAAATDLSLGSADLTARQTRLADEWIGAFLIVSLTLVALSVSVRMMARYGERQGMPFAAAGLSRALIRVVVVTIGLMSLLANFGKSITPLLTALGVGGLAVALALQDTLANFFAGIHILVERPIFVGDSIRLSDGQEGVVTDIGWRTTRVRNGANDMVIVPNSKITAGTLINYNLPDHREVAEVAILVAHDADPALVSRIALEEASRTAGVLPEPAPVCLCDPGVLPTHLQFKLVVNVARHDDQGGVLSEVRLRLLERFREEGVPPPDLDIVHANRR
ncbi:MAG: mechanosensitive ion channel family protein [Bryobacteraceae bacterium]|jgi:small-conductance mechanosensitive channel